MSRVALGFSLAIVASTASAASIAVRATDALGKPVADAAVYAVPAAGGSEAKNARASIAQVEREFVPYVSVIQQGTVVTFPNRDPILHHVYSFSPAKQFEIKLYTGKSPSEIQFDRAGVVTLGCNIHDWMAAYVVIVPTPYFARTDESGTALLRDLPAGAYEVRAWHPHQRAALAPQALTLAGSTEATSAFAFDLLARKPKFKPPMDRLRY
jgi:plastocyanin